MLIDLHLKYLESKLKKNCIYHHKESQLFCLKLNCNKCPYLCQLCNKEGIHMHKDKIGNFEDFVRQLCTDIFEYQQFYRDSKEPNQVGISNLIKQQTDVLKCIQKLQIEISEKIRQSKQKIIQEIELNSQRLKKTGNQKIKYYKNPNILVNKLISESSIDFIINLKKNLNYRKQQSETQSDINSFSNELNNLKANIKNILDNNLGIISPQRTKTVSERIQIKEKKIYQLPVMPIKIYNYNDRMIVCGQKISFLYNLEQKKANPIQFPIILCASNKQKMKNEFIAVSPPNTLLHYADGNKKIIKIKNDCTAIAVICATNQVCPIVGYQDGQIQVYSLTSQSSIQRLKNNNGRINNISVIDSDNIILVSSKDGKVSLYKYKSKNQNALKLDFLNYLSVGMEDLMGHQVYKKDIVLFNAMGNIKIYDFIANQLLIQTNLPKDKPIVDLVIYPTAKKYFLITTIKNQKELKVWNIDKQRGNYKFELLNLSIKNPEICRNTMFVWNENLWILKEASPAVFVAYLEVS